MTSNLMNNKLDGISLRNAALIAGIGLLIMVLTVPFAEFQIFPSLIDYTNPKETVRKILDKKSKSRRQFSILNFILLS